MQKFIIADDYSIFLAGLAKTIASESDWQIVARRSNTVGLLNSLEQVWAPNSIVVFGSTLLTTDEEWADFLAKISQNKVKTIAMIRNENYSKTNNIFFKKMSGLISCSVETDEFKEKVRCVIRGDAVSNLNFSKEPASLENTRLVTRSQEISLSLTKKQKEIVACIVKGWSNKAIALYLGNTEQVIKNYLRGVYDRVGVDNRTNLALFVLRHPVLLDTVNNTLANFSAKHHPEENI